MTTTLNIELLGGVTFQHDNGMIIGFRSRKAEAILAYLIMQKRPISRAELATIFWRDSDPTQAMANLRRVTHDLRKRLGEWLLISRHTLAFNQASDYQLDVDRLTAGFTAVSDTPLSDMQAQQLDDALSHFKGEFLTGLYIQGAPEFDDWAALERERLNLQASHHLNRLTAYYLHHGRYPQGISHGQHWVALAPYNEEAHRRLMRLLARDGQYNAALTQYETINHRLTTELGIEPARATQAWRQRIVTARNQSRSQLPALHTLFVGRKNELALLDRWLDDPKTRLVTLLGLGGCGKTRLGLQMGTRRQRDYLHGVFFVSLTAATTTDTLIQSIADAIGFTIQGTQSPQLQLLNHIREKEMLLILDNVEQIVAMAASLVTAILDVAPFVQLLVTSRERLALRAERLLRVDGLQHGETDSDALTLFHIRAAAMLPDFELTAVTRPVAHQICDLMDGLPLGIELAAIALSYHTLPQIVAEIQHNLDFVTAHQRDLPPRQRSLRAVFTYSWQLLTAAEQTAFAHLTPFRGGFTLEAARQVAVAQVGTLRRLTDKTIVRVDENGRYHIHELLRQFATEYLTEETAVRDKHSAYFAHFLQTFDQQLQGEQQAEATDAIQQEIDNVYAGWEWAISQANWQQISDYAVGLHFYLEIKSTFQEGRQRFEHALTALRSAPETSTMQFALGRVLARLGVFCERLARMDKADAYLEESVALFQQLGAIDEAIFAFNHMGVVAHHRGDYARAIPQFEQALVLNREIDNKPGIAHAQNYIAVLLFEMGEYEKARAACEESLQIHRALGNERDIAMSSNTLALFLEAQGDIEAAEHIHQENLERCIRLEDKMGEAMTRHKLGNYARQRGELAVAVAHYQRGFALFGNKESPWIDALFSTRLGNVAEDAGTLEEATQQYEHALAVCREIGDLRGVVITRLGLGRVAMANGRLQKTQSHVQDALIAAQTMDAPAAILDVFAMQALLLARLSQQEPALALGLFVTQHPACTHEARASIADLLADLGQDVALMEKASETASTLSLKTAVALIQS